MSAQNQPSTQDQPATPAHIHEASGPAAPEPTGTGAGTSILRLVHLIRRHPLAAFFVWFFTVGQAFAFYPVLVPDAAGLPPQLFIVAATLFGLLLPAVVITGLVDGRSAVRALGHRIIPPRRGVAWYALALLGVPLLSITLTVLLVGAPVDTSWSSTVTVLIPHLLLPLLLTFLPNNLWEEVAWMGFVQARLQTRRGPLMAAVITGPLFALQHIALVVGNSPVAALAVIGLLAVFAIPFRFATAWIYNKTGNLFLVGLFHATGNAATGGSGFQTGLLATVYPNAQIASIAHLLAFALIGIMAVLLTRGRLGMPDTRHRSA